MTGTRLLLLRLLVERAATTYPCSAEIARVAESYTVISGIQQTHPDLVAELLAYPQLGPWLAHVLGRFERRDDAQTPIWADLGYLGWLAAGCSIAAHAEGTMSLIMRHGVIMLPGLGLARVGSPGTHGPCELRWTSTGAITFTTENGSVTTSLQHDANIEWFPLRTVGDSAGDAPRIYLDDLDPFRDLPEISSGREGSVPGRLTRHQNDCWSRNLSEALALLEQHHPRYCQRNANPDHFTASEF